MSEQGRDLIASVNGTIHAGIYTDQSAEAYHADRSAISRGRISAFIDNPQSLQWWLAGLIEEDKPTNRMEIGTATHGVLLEPGLFEREYTVAPAGLAKNKVVKAYKDFAKEVIASGKNPLSADEGLRVAGMASSVRNLKIGSALTFEQLAKYTGSRLENSYYWNEFGLPLRARLDLFVDIASGTPIIVDVKTTEKLQRDMRRYAREARWWLQAAHYSRAIMAHFKREPKFYFLVVLSKAPFTARLLHMTPKTMRIAHARYSELLGQIRHRMEANEWGVDDWPDSIDHEPHELYW